MAVLRLVMEVCRTCGVRFFVIGSIAPAEFFGGFRPYDAVGLQALPALERDHRDVGHFAELSVDGEFWPQRQL
jgi:hypothetical protein